MFIEIKISTGTVSDLKQHILDLCEEIDERTARTGGGDGGNIGDPLNDDIYDFRELQWETKDLGGTKSISIKPNGYEE